MSPRQQPHHPETLPRSARIRSQKVFSAAFAERRRLSDHRLTIYVIPNKLGLTRLGISVGRRAGGAVRRNRLKRLIREAFRRVRHQLSPGMDLVIVPHHGKDFSVLELQNSIILLAERLQGRLAQD
jgi:ribonuclease P protein component